MMRRLILLAALCVMFGYVGSADAQPRRLLSRFHFLPAGPIQIPIPGFGPWFPGGNVTLLPRDGEGDGGQAPSGKVYVSADVKARLDRIETLVKGDVLTKTNAIPKVFGGRDYAEIKGGAAAKTGTAGKGRSLPEEDLDNE